MSFTLQKKFIVLSSICLPFPSSHKLTELTEPTYQCWSYVSYSSFKMRRNVLNLSRLAMQSLFCKNEIQKKLLSKYLSQCRLAGIPDGSTISKIKLADSRPYTQTNVTNCWNCQKPTDVNIAGAKESFFCSSCGCLQEVNFTYVRDWI